MSKRDLKKYLNELNKEQLEEQIINLYDKFPAVKTYYDFVFKPNERQLLQDFKLKVSNEYFPVKSKKVKARRSVAQKMIKHFISLGVDPFVIVDAMLYSIEIAQTYSYQVLDANRVYTQNTIGAEVSTSDKAVLFALYGEVMKNLEWSRMMLVNQTPVVQVLDRPDFPLVDNRFSIAMYLFLGGIFATLFFLLIQLIAYSNNKNKQ